MTSFFFSFFLWVRKGGILGHGSDLLRIALTFSRRTGSMIILILGFSISVSLCWDVMNLCVRNQQQLPRARQQIKVWATSFPSLGLSLPSRVSADDPPRVEHSWPPKHCYVMASVLKDIVYLYFSNLKQYQNHLGSELKAQMFGLTPDLVSQNPFPSKFQLSKLRAGSQD